MVCRGVNGVGGARGGVVSIGLLACVLGALVLACHGAFASLLLGSEREVLRVGSGDAHMTAAAARCLCAECVGGRGGIAPHGHVGRRGRAGFFCAPAHLRSILFDHVFLQSITNR